jgi:hypothetical protein
MGLTAVPAGVAISGCPVVHAFDGPVGADMVSLS